MSERDPKTGRFPPGNGAGWGGAKKRKSTSRFQAGDEHRGAHTASAIEAKAERVARHLDNIERIAFHGETETNRLNASRAIVDILDPPTKRIALGGDAAGQPVAITVTIEDLTESDAEPEGPKAASAAGQD